MSDTSATKDIGRAEAVIGPSRRTERDLRLLAARFALPLILVIFVVFFSLVRPETYATSSNFKSIVTNQAVLGILAIGLVLPLVVGEFDLSVAANLGLAAILVTGLPSKSGVAFVLALIIALLVCSAVGLVNGLLVARAGLNSLVVTLATSTIVTGAVQWYTNGNVLYSHIPKGLTTIGQGSIIGIPRPGVYLIVIAVVAWFVLEQTALGRYLYATGGSKDASRLSGIKVDRLVIMAFVGAGFLAGIAGVVQASLLGSGNPTVGPPFLLPAFSAVFLGATTIRLATFNVLGTVIAVFTLAAGITGLQLMGVAFYIAPVFQGVALILAVAAVRILRREAI
jgi:ribose transport system permease protein